MTGNKLFSILFTGSVGESEEDILIEKKQESDEDTEVTIRKRIPKTDDTQS